MVDHLPDPDVSDSESSDHAPSGQRKTKRRRLHGACDTCRKKKIKCDSAIAPNNICSNCINSKVQCTHNIPRQKKKDTQQEYIRTLEERLRTMEELLRQSQSAGSHSPQSSRASSEPHRGSASPSSQDTTPILPLPIHRSPLDAGADLEPSNSSVKTADEDNDLIHVALAERLKSLSMQSVEGRFFGQSSMFSLAQQAVVLQTELGHDPPESFANVRRNYFWRTRDWETDFIDRDNRRTQYVFPEPDLFDSLIELFFERVYTVCPAVHRPSFERDIRAGRHFTDHMFGMVVLAAVSLGARYSDDPRVFERPLDPDEFEGSNAGWKWVTQVPLWRNSLCDRTTIYDLQFFALGGMYYLGSSMPQICWTMTGLGLRLAQEKGLHRRKGNDLKPTVESELEKRVFWCLISADRIQGSFLGRTPGIHDEDIDCDYPVECDDEYWEADDPEDAFKQPEGKPSTAAAFTWTLKLCEIIAFMSRTLYSTKKSRLLAGLVGDEWETRVVTELDSSLNKWRDTLPRHLAWDPTNPDTKFFNQCLFLHSTYYYTQIQVHRPFLNRTTPLALSSRAICTNAARHCSRAVEISLKRQHRALTPHVMMSAFVSAMVLTVNFWSCRALNLNVNYDPVREMADIERCRAYMIQGEKRWFVAGRLGDMITEFSLKRGPARAAAIAEEASKTQSHKRARPSEMSIPAFQPQIPPNIISDSSLSTQPMAGQQHYDTFMSMSEKDMQPIPPMLHTAEAFGLGPTQHDHDRNHQQPQTHYMQQQQQQQQQQRHVQHQPVRPQRHHEAMPNISQPRPSSQLMANDWDLGALILAQMGYGALPGNNFGVTMPGTGSGSSTPSYSSMQQQQQQPQQNLVPMAGPGGGMYHNSSHDDSDIFAEALANQPDSSAPPGYAESLLDMGMWMSTAQKPTNNSADDWDAYLAAMGSHAVSGVGTF